MSSNDDLAALARESRITLVLSGILFPTVIGSIFVLARLWTRIMITRNFGLDDIFILISWIASLGLVVANCLFTRFGIGHHQIFQTLDQVVPVLKLAFTSRFLYQFVLCTTKLSICSFYLRVFQDMESKKWVYAITAFVVVTAVVNQLWFIFLCSPISDAWSLTGHCKPSNPSTISNAVCNILSDAFLMVFVIPRVLPLQMNTRQKTSLLVVVSLGIIVMAASIVRTTLALSLDGDPDLTWTGSTITTWTTVEVSTGLFCASAPCIRPLLRQVTPGFLSSTLSRSAERTDNKTKSKHYGNGTIIGAVSKQLSRRERADAYELRSTVEEEDRSFSRASLGVPAMPTRTGNAFWIGKGSGIVTGRDGKEDVYHNDMDIIQTNTVSVTVEDGEGSINSNSESGGGKNRDLEVGSVESSVRHLNFSKSDNELV